MKKILDKPNNPYQVSLGFSLHIGWSIEAAIGSHLKIDLAYLGRHVNFASTLEKKTKEYGTNLILR